MPCIVHAPFPGTCSCNHLGNILLNGVMGTIGRPVVFTANADSLRRWFSDAESGGTEEASTLKARLKNHSILAYDKGGHGGLVVI